MGDRVMSADRTGDLKVPDWPGRRADDPGHDRIAAMLVLDIGNAPQWAGRVAREIEDVVTGTSSGWEMVMNARLANTHRTGEIGIAECRIAAFPEQKFSLIQ